MDQNDALLLGGQEFHSRLFVGTGKFASNQVMLEVVRASGTQLVTVALRRVDFNEPTDPVYQGLPQSGVRLLPNTAGARNAEEAVRMARLGRELSQTPWVKLEVTPEPRYLLPDPIETLRAAEQLVREGFVVLPYMNADPILAKHLEEAGVAAVMPLAAPIGSNQGLRTRDMLRIIIEQARVPVVVDAGLGAPSHAAAAMEMGAAAVLVNTALAIATQPIQMAEAFRLAVIAGRTAFCAGLAPTEDSANASSPLTGFLR